MRTIMLDEEYLEEIKKTYVELNIHIKYLKEKEENYPPRYYKNEGCIEIIDFLLDKMKGK